MNSSDVATRGLVCRVSCCARNTTHHETAIKCLTLAVRAAKTAFKTATFVVQTIRLSLTPEAPVEDTKNGVWRVQ
jgi:hypothetical protein